MGKFGRHSDFFVENDGTSDFVVPYNVIKGYAGGSNTAGAAALTLTTIEQQVESTTLFETTQRDEFEQQWRKNLERVCVDFGSAISEFWRKIFAKIADLDGARGCLPGVAISLYVDAVGREQAQELLARLKQIHKAAYHNTEALRKLVKKFDKKKNPEEAALSPVLLPLLYTANFTVGQQTLEEGISLLRELLEQTNGNVPITTAVSLGFVEDDGYDSDKSKNEQIVEDRQSELEWLLRLTSSMENGELAHLVAHRGFHSVQDYIHRRPNENSLTAYETAWCVRSCACV
jgi:hypothetical protein